MYSLGSADAQVARFSSTFQNPIAPGADPWVVQHEGSYFWCLSNQDQGVVVYRSESLTRLGERFVVWQAPQTGPHCAQVWAPELHFLAGRWYIYVAVSDGRNETHRMIVLESDGADATRPFHFKAELYTGDDPTRQEANRWAIDGTVLELNGRRYFLWSGWADARDEQWLYAAEMANPWTLATTRVRLCRNADHLWERIGESRRERGLNEGPQVLRRGDRVFVVYSCSGSWEPSYKLAVLELTPGGNPLDPTAWHKHQAPALESRLANACGVGHCSFTKSADGTEDWIVFHAKVTPTHGWQRAIHIQPFGWTTDGRPDFGVVTPPGLALARPSGEGASLVAPEATRKLILDVRIHHGAGETSGETVAAG